MNKIDDIPLIIDDEKIKEIYGGDYKKALVEVGKNERKYILKCYLLEQKIDKYKEVIDKIKEYTNILLFELNRGKEFEKWEEILNPILELLEEIE